MVAVRYAALAALVLWIGGMVSILVGDVFARFPAAVACGMVVLVSLFVMKFVGPPPQGFKARLALAILMLGVAIFGQAARKQPVTHPALLALGLIMLTWYARE